MDELERLNAFIEAAGGKYVLVSPSDGRIVGVKSFGDEDDSHVTAEYFRLPADEGRKAAKNFKNAQWAELPPLRISTNVEGLEGVALNVAPVAYFIWEDGDGLFIDEMCSNAHGEDCEWHGIGSGLAYPFSRDANGEMPDFDDFCDGAYGGGASQSAFEDWFGQLQKSPDPDVKKFGLALERTFIHMENHDLDGSWTGEGPDPDGPDAPEEDSEDTFGIGM